MTEEQISWDEATVSGSYIKLVEGKLKKLVVTNWGFRRKAKDAKYGANEVEFYCTAISEDDVVCEKEWSSVSNRLKLKLKDVLETKESSEQVVLSVMMVGDKFNTQYSVEEIQG